MQFSGRPSMRPSLVWATANLQEHGRIAQIELVQLGQPGDGGTGAAKGILDCLGAGLGAKVAEAEAGVGFDSTEPFSGRVRAKRA